MAGSGVGRECLDIKIFLYETPVNSYMVIVTGISVAACGKCRTFSRMFASQCNETMFYNPAKNLSSAKLMIKNNLVDSSDAYNIFSIIFRKYFILLHKVYEHIFCVQIVFSTISCITENLYNQFLLTGIEIRWD